MAVEATFKNVSIECLKHNVPSGQPCLPSSRNKHEPQFSGHVCGSRFRKTKNL